MNVNKLSYLTMFKEKRNLNLLIFGLLLIYGIITINYIFSENICLGHDDAFISYQYAKNFSNGNGLVFNKGEKIWGYTSPANTILLGVLTFFGFDTFNISIIIGILFVVFGSFIIFKIISKFFHPVYAFSISILYLSNPNAYSYLGLETNFLIFTQLLILYLILEKKYNLACLIAALSCLVRPDSIIFVIPLMLFERKMLKIKNLLYFIIPGLLWCIFSFFYYGDILPNTFYAKKGSSDFLLYIFTYFKKLISNIYIDFANYPIEMVGLIVMVFGLSGLIIIRFRIS